MKVLVTGCSGFIGTHLCAGLPGEWQVCGVVRRGVAPQRVQATWSDLSAAAGHLQDIDVVFHLAGLAHAGAQQADTTALQRVNVDATVALFQAAVAAGVSKFIWLSSIKVLGEGFDLQTADTNLAVDTPKQPVGAYARSKARAEDQLTAIPSENTQLAMVRPPLVYGPGVKANFRRLMQLALSPWPLPLATATHPRAWLGVDNLVDFLCHLAAPATADIRGIWHVRDNEQSSTRQMLELITQAAGQHPYLWPVAERWLRALAARMGQTGTMQRLFNTLTVDMTSTQQRLGWQPPFTQQQQIAKAVAWHQTQ